jgi:hypothetical protein
MTRLHERTDGFVPDPLGLAAAIGRAKQAIIPFSRNVVDACVDLRQPHTTPAPVAPPRLLRGGVKERDPRMLTGRRKQYVPLLTEEGWHAQRDGVVRARANRVGATRHRTS